MQNLHTLNLTPEQLEALNTSLATIESIVGSFALSPKQRRRIVKMGDRSEAFCSQAFVVMGNHPEIIPPTMDVADAQRDLDAVFALRPVLARLEVLVERVQDAEMALGSDAMDAALKGYGLLKLMGRARGLTALRSQLSARFLRQTREVTEGEEVLTPA